MNLSPAGLDFIKQWEGFRPAPYNDGAGYMTIGYGHRIQPGERFTTITEGEALQILAEDSAWAQAAVSAYVKVPLTQSMFDALVSLVFNWGSGNFLSSTHLQKLNAGDYYGAADRIKAHPITAGGKVMQGLINRRAAEYELFLREGLPIGNFTMPLAAKPVATIRQPARALIFLAYLTRKLFGLWRRWRSHSG